MRWKAPELFLLSTAVTDLNKVESTRPTEKSDMYSLAMVTIEVPVPCLAQIPVSNSLENPQIFTGKHPFALYSDEQVILLLAQDGRPEKPTHEQFTSKIWTLTTKCWDKDPEKRPNVAEVLRRLESGEGAFSVIHTPRRPLLKKRTGNNRLMSFSASLTAFFGSLQFGGRSDTN